MSKIRDGVKEKMSMNGMKKWRGEWENLKKTASGNMQSIFKIIIGNLLITFAYAFFTVPNHIINGGVTSFAMVVQNYLPFAISTITNVFVVILLFISYIFLGKAFLIKSLLSSVCYMFFFSTFNVIHNYFSIPIVLPVSVIVASVLVGTGYFFCLNAGASAVGFDVIALVIHKKHSKADVALTMRYINYGVLLLGIIAYGIWAVVIGIVFTYLQTAVLGILFKKKEREVAKKKTGSDVEKTKVD